MVTENIKKPIFITGCARSGTSLTAGIIDKSGIWGGNTCGPTPHNQKGQFENTEIRNRVIKGYLRFLNVDPMGQNPLPNIDIVKKDAVIEGDATREEVLSILITQGYKNNNVRWYLKGAKLCLIWPLWNAAFPTAKWVVVRRDDYDICSSCLKTSFMRAFNRRNGWLYWVGEHKKRFEEMHKAGLDIFEFWPFRVINGNEKHLEELLNYLDVEYTQKLKRDIQDFISPNLWHFKEEGGI